jgi:hypothetical protein
MRHVNLNGVVLVAHADHDRGSGMHIAFLKQALDVRASDFLLGGLAANPRQSKEHPVGGRHGLGAVGHDIGFDVAKPFHKQ